MTDAANDEGQSAGTPGEQDGEALWASMREKEGADAPAEETPAEEPEANEPEPAEAPADASVDPWANAPAALREAYEAQKREFESLRTNYGRVSGTVSALQRKLNEERRAYEQSQRKPPEDDPSIAKAREEFPDVVAPIEKMISAAQERQRQEMDGVAARLEAYEQAEASREIDRRGRELESLHPDWREVTRSPQYQGWLERQSPTIQGIAMHSTEVADADAVLKLFKFETASRQAAPVQDVKRQQMLAAASAPRTKEAPRATSGPPEDPAALWDYLAALERKQARR